MYLQITNIFCTIKKMLQYKAFLKIFLFLSLHLMIYHYFQGCTKSNIDNFKMIIKYKKLEIQGASCPSFQAFRALRAHLLFKLRTCSFCLHFKTKKKKMLRIFKKRLQNFFYILFCFQLLSLLRQNQNNRLWIMEGLLHSSVTTR